jgi:hypothetical protein
MGQQDGLPFTALPTCAKSAGIMLFNLWMSIIFISILQKKLKLRKQKALM